MMGGRKHAAQMPLHLKNATKLFTFVANDMIKPVNTSLQCTDSSENKKTLNTYIDSLKRACCLRD